MNIQEKWMPVDGFDGLYEISNTGRLKSYHDPKFPDGKILSVKNKNGWYLTVRLSKNGKYTTKRIHTMVAEAFLGKIEEGYTVHHIDGDKQNNIVTNLEIIQKKEHAVKTLAQKPDLVVGMNNFNRYERPRHIRQYTKDGHYIAEYANSKIAEKFTGICYRNILQVARKDEYKPGAVRTQAGGYVWKFSDECEDNK